MSKSPTRSARQARLSILRRYFFTHKHEAIYWVDFALLVIGSAMAVVAATIYTVIYQKKLKEVRASGILDTLDRYGNPLPHVEEKRDEDAAVEENAKDSENLSSDEDAAGKEV